MPTGHLSDDDYERLARCVAGEGSAVEHAETERWAREDAERREALAAMRLAWGASITEPAWDVDRAWRTLATRLEEPSRELRIDSKVVDIGIKRRWWRDNVRIMRAAAALVVIIGGALIIPRLRSTSGSSPQAVASAAMFTTQPGEHRTVNLPDGSTVVLGVSSSLHLRDGYGADAREVELTGEALFTVEHDAKRPFRVHVNGSVVEDLGTEFAVRGYGQGTTLRVAVASGSVAVRRGTSADTAVVLAPRDVATVGDAGAVTVARNVDVAPFTAFASGRLVFTDASLADVVVELERWYGVEVRVIDDAILDRHLTSTFEGESLDEVLRVIGMTLDVRYVRNGNRIDFMKQGDTSALPSPAATVVLAEAGA